MVSVFEIDGRGFAGQAQAINRTMDCGGWVRVDGLWWLGLGRVGRMPGRAGAKGLGLKLERFLIQELLSFGF